MSLFCPVFGQSFVISEVTKHTMATEQPWMHSAILPSSTAGCLVEVEKKSREEGQSLTQVSEQVKPGLLRRSALVCVGVAARSTNLISIDSSVRCHKSTVFCYCVIVFVCEGNHRSECATGVCLRASEIISNGTNSLKIHPHNVHPVSKYKNAK